jgi:hypothetical protein
MIKLKDLLTEYQNEPDIKKQWAVVLKGGSIGSRGRGWAVDGLPIRYSFDSEDEAKNQAKRSNKRLSPGERKHYGMRYLVRDIVKFKSKLRKEELDPYKDFGGEEHGEADLNLGAFIDSYQTFVKEIKKIKPIPDKNKKAWALAIRKDVGQGTFNGFIHMWKKPLEVLTKFKKYEKLKS